MPIIVDKSVTEAGISVIVDMIIDSSGISNAMGSCLGIGGD
jgi:hypothetical protein